MQSQLHKKPQYSSLFKRLTAWTGVFAITLALIFTFSKTAHAGLLSLITTVFGDQQASAQTNKISGGITNFSQIGTVLQAHSSFNPTSDVLADIAPFDGNGETLVPDLVPSNVNAGYDLNTEISTYVVRQGDTISSVAKMFKVSVNTILWANDLTSRSVLQAGQTLVILPISGITYTVKKGDTIKGIASRNNADVEDILNYNDLTLSTSLTVGQVIILPNAELSTPIVPKTISHGTLKIAPNEPLLDDVSILPSYPGYFIRPISIGRVSQELHGHNAVDFAAPVGTPIHASASGTVIISRSNGAWNGGYGNFIVVSHQNGTQTLYAHMSRTAASVGEQVSQGETIGYIGMTGLTTGPHVHFEVRGARNPF